MEPQPILAGPEFLADPYPTFDRVRAKRPARWDPQAGCWDVTGYAQVAAALRDPRLAADRSAMFRDGLPPAVQAEVEPLIRLQADMMLFADPPKHTRLRGLVNAAFIPRIVESLRPRIQATVDALLDPFAATGELDVIGDLAVPLPTMVIAALLGVAAEDHDRLKRWSDDFAAFIGGRRHDPGVPARARGSMAELTAYLRAVIAERRVAPRADLISALVAVEAGGDALTEEELVATCVVVLIAGHETTTNLIGNGLLALLRNPDQRAALDLDHDMPRPAIEELLRFDSPVQLTSRLAAADLDLGGERVRRGQVVILWLGAANRDPARFADPARLDLGRPDNRHLAFGYGPHFCVGALLARLEGQLATQTLLRRFPRLRLTEEPLTYQETVVFRALDRLPVAL